MKVKLDVSPELRDAVAAELTSRGIELDEDAPYVLTERGRFAEALTLRDGRRVDVTRSYYYSFKEALGI